MVQSWHKLVRSAAEGSGHASDTPTSTCTWQSRTQRGHEKSWGAGGPRSLRDCALEERYRWFQSEECGKQTCGETRIREGLASTAATSACTSPCPSCSRRCRTACTGFTSTCGPCRATTRTRAARPTGSSWTTRGTTAHRARPCPGRRHCGTRPYSTRSRGTSISGCSGGGSGGSTGPGPGRPGGGGRSSGARPSGARSSGCRGTPWCTRSARCGGGHGWRWPAPARTQCALRCQ